MITVVCFKWFDPQGRWNRSFTYGADHVARLRSMVLRNLATPHEFVCATDNASDLPPGVRAVPINERLWQARHRYAKLDIFRPDAGAVYGERILAFDLDCVITGPLDPLLDGVGEFKIWGDTAKGTPYNSSLVYLEAGKRAQVYEDFDPIGSPREAKASGYIGSDQAWIGHKLGAGEAKWSQADGVLSYKADCLRKRNGALPDGARVVFFHGEVDPSLKECQRKSPWIVKHWRKDARPKSCLVLGGGASVWDDAEAALDIGEFDGVVAVNDAGSRWPGPLRAWVTLHPEKLHAWERQRADRGYPKAFETWSNKRSGARGKIETTIDRITDDWRGSSGLLAVKAAIEMGYRRIVLCGVPLDAEGGHFFDGKPWKSATVYRRSWQERRAEIAPYTRSMGGWTAHILGKPTAEWLATP